MPTKSFPTTSKKPSVGPSSDGTFTKAQAEKVTGKKLLDFDTPLVQVRQSAVHGLGLFAAARIAKGALIGTAQGRRTKRNNDHVLWIEEHDGEVWGLEPLNEFRFTNHDDDPNAIFFGEELYAARAIAKGEEICFHYDGDVEPAD
jgi:SET domain-containing protein